MYLQCKLALQVQSKHIKIFKKNKKQKTNKKKKKTKTKVKPTSILEGEKRKEKVHLTN